MFPNRELYQEEVRGLYKTMRITIDYIDRKTGDFIL